MNLFEKVEAVSRLKTYLFLYEEVINAAAGEEGSYADPCSLPKLFFFFF
jgi:hypothetical protein